MQYSLEEWYSFQSLGEIEIHQFESVYMSTLTSDQADLVNEFLEPKLPKFLNISLGDQKVHNVNVLNLIIRKGSVGQIDIFP